MRTGATDVPFYAGSPAPARRAGSAAADSASTVFLHAACERSRCDNAAMLETAPADSLLARAAAVIATELADGLVAAFAFGSRAEGRAHRESDLEPFLRRTRAVKLAAIAPR